LRGRERFFQRSANRALVDSARYGDAGLAEDVGNLSVAEARGVVFEGEMRLLFVDAKAAQAIGVGECAEAAELFETQGRLQFVSDFEERHARNYNSTRNALRTGASAAYCGPWAAPGNGLDSV
jgi:hypothetical protein